jgi:hypothetical protein
MDWMDGDRVVTVSQVTVLMEKERDRVETDRDAVETAFNTVGWDEMGDSREAGKVAEGGEGSVGWS